MENTGEPTAIHSVEELEERVRETERKVLQKDFLRLMNLARQCRENAQHLLNLADYYEEKAKEIRQKLGFSQEETIFEK